MLSHPSVMFGSALFRAVTKSRFGTFLFGVALVSLSLGRAVSSEIDPSLKITPALRERILCGKSDERVSAWVFFTDKGMGPSRIREELFLAEEKLSSGARLRRGKAGRPVLVDESDLLVNENYVSGVAETGAVVRVRSKWLNCVSVSAGETELEEIASLPFVKEMRPVLKRAISPDELIQASPAGYGSSWGQLNMIQIPTLHDLSFHGEGVTIGVLDTGFNLNHEALDSVNVIAKWDFINSDSVVADEPGEDTSGQHNHGTFILGIIGGRSPDKLMGGAYGASFVLAKTEMVNQEIPAEEDLWVRGIEWAESIGVDVVTSSLGYIDWYSYQDMDGNTAVTTIAADMAVGNGIVVANAMGNGGGSSYPYMIAPADGDSVVSCGAVDWAESIAWFSSRGPTYDGRRKPDVCAQGVSVYTVNAANPTQYTYISGTSASTPLVASACALLLQAHPSWTPVNVADALRFTASRSSSPDTAYGWGVVRAYDAYLYTPVSAEEEDYAEARNPGLFWISPNPSSGALSIYYDNGRINERNEVRIFDVRGNVVRVLEKNRREALFAFWDGKDSSGKQVASGVYLIALQTDRGTVKRKAVVIR